MRRSIQEWQTMEDELTDDDPQSQKNLIKNGDERARDTTRRSITPEDNQTENSPSKERVQQAEKDLRKQQQNTYQLKKEIKLLEVKNFKLSNNFKGISAKFLESATRIEELEGQLKNMEQALAEKTHSLMAETARRRDLSEKVAGLKVYRDRALDAEKLVKELKDDNQRLKIQVDASQLKAITSRNESESLKAELKMQSDILKTKENTIDNFKMVLDAKEKIIDAQKEEIKKQRKVAQETEMEAKRNRQNEETSMKRLKHKDDENLSLRKEITSLHKSLHDFDRKMSKQESKYQVLQEKCERAQTEKANLQKKYQKLKTSAANLEKEIVETQTLLEKSKQETQFYKHRVEQVKIKLVDTKDNSKENKIKFEKDLLRTQEDYMKLKTQREDALTKNRRAAEVLFSNNRKIGIQADIIREQECKIVELTKEVLRLHANEQKFRMVKETYSKVQRLGLNEENGDIILLPDTDKKTEKLTMLRTENRRLSTKLKEKVTEIENLKLEEANLQNVMKCLKSKLDHVPEDVMLQVQESQTTIKALRRQKKALDAEYDMRQKINENVELLCLLPVGLLPSEPNVTGKRFIHHHGRPC
ncbi:kinetochore protein SLK19-like isoform X1 [Gambusia affinis]|uniref:kinetochore protein SLK19-like isoform X1 n=1 Tax=Gambusia affinis TaxID=33528 RepID=UPI001CDCBCC3|nr:kinetochore protein SLK19-like isoform X1 [Gambusia affinis]